MRGFTIMVATILSTVLHFFILTLLDTIPLISKEIPPQPDFYMVDLVPLAVEQSAPQRKEETTVQHTAEVKKETVQKEEVTREEVKKEEAKKEEVKKEEVKKEEVKKDDKAVVADPGTEEQEKKEKTEGQPRDPDEQLVASIEEIKQKVAAREKGDSPADEVTTAEIQAYGNTVIESVKRSWAILNIWSEEELEAFIVIEVDEKGQVTCRFEESSGNIAFDQAAMRAIRKAAPFDPPPGNKALTFPPLRFSSR